MRTVPEAMEWTRLGRTKLYEELRSGRLRSVKVGRRRLIPDQALQAWQESLVADSPPEDSLSCQGL